ncbi:MAG: NAD(P)H-quinone oxidoreductase [Betaproteobacteria bacterium]|nr:NAD(P)H-quinone oxidoreductase [Betaproteobacteria bacterium]
MHVVEISQPGGPEVLRPAQRPLPVLKAGEVMIQVAAAGVNRPDCFQRAGLYPPPPGASDLPGLEVAGTIVQVGPGVSQWKTGDQVCALTPGGGYAQYCATPAGHCLPIPKGLTLTEAATLPETVFTVWINVFERARLAAGECLLVQGGSSGIGVTAIQIARAMGHRVFATAGSAEKCAACESLGAERAINYKTEDFAEVVKSITQGRGVDVILDMVAGTYIQRQLSCLADDGRMSIIAFLGGSKAEVDFNDVLRRRLTITGSTLRPRSAEFKTAIAATLLQRVWPLIEQGKVKPQIYRRFALDRACDAHTMMESSSHIGKIVLEL